MRGEILDFNTTEGRGLITGDDGNRYDFSAADMKQMRAVKRGDRVDFTSDGNAAREIFVLTAGTGAEPVPGYAVPVSKVPANHPSMRHKLGNPWAYFKKCMKLYADGKGRAGVAEFWSFILFQFLLLLPFFVLMFSDPAIGSNGEPGAMFFIGLIGVIVVALGLVIPGITVTIRRLHDLGMSGWLYLLVFVFGSLFTIIIGVIPSQDNPNEHGPSPKNPGTVADAFA